MSERKVLTKYYPPDFDPRQIQRVRGPKKTGPKVQTVRLMAPFSMKCLSCGEFIYKGRKFNSRKETPESERYLGVQIFRFYIRCTRCSAEIVFKTDPKNNDYTCEKGAKRNVEPWHNKAEAEETTEERLDRLEREEADEAERNAMQELETKTIDAKREMAVADALDEIRTRNARMERADGSDGLEVGVARDDEAERQDREDAEAARRAFAAASKSSRLVPDYDDDDDNVGDEEKTAAGIASGGSLATSSMSKHEKDSAAMPPPPSFKRVVKKKKDHASLLGIKKKPSIM